MRSSALTALVAATLMAGGCSSSGDADDDEVEAPSADALVSFGQDCSGAPGESQLCDQGLYWFGKGNKGAKWFPNQANPNYDVKKPTVIYVHGWQSGTVTGRVRESFNYKENDPENGVDVNAADAWIDAGWNIGIFYWDRLADDPGEGVISAPDAAEAKIWRLDGPTGMRWRKDDNTYETVNVPKKTAADMFYDTYAAALKDYVGPNVRIAGHSLGNQMAVRLVDRVSKAVEAGQLPKSVMPRRLALLDPYWTVQREGDDRAGAARDVRDAIFMLARNGLAIEQYRTSSINELGLGDTNPFVRSTAAYAEIYPHWPGWLNSVLPSLYMRSDHRAAPNLYFWSFQFPAPWECYKSSNPAALSAAATDQAIRAEMGPDHYWVQEEGQGTATPKDDCFTKKKDARPTQVPMAVSWKKTAPGTIDISVDSVRNAARVRYFVAGHKVGTAELGQTGAKFGATLTGLPTDAPETLLVATAYDQNDSQVGTSENMIDLTQDPGMSVRQLSRMTFEVGFDGDVPGLASVELDVDGAAVTDMRNNARRSDKKSVRAIYEEMDAVKRTFVLRGYDAAGAEIKKLERHFILR